MGRHLQACESAPRLRNPPDTLAYQRSIHALRRSRVPWKRKIRLQREQGMTSALLNQTTGLQQCANRACRWPLSVGVMRFKPRLQLLRPSEASLLSQFNDKPGFFLVHLMRPRLWGAGQVDQRCKSSLPVPLHPSVSRVSTDSVPLRQLRYAPLAASILFDELLALVLGTRLFPGQVAPPWP